MAKSYKFEARDLACARWMFELIRSLNATHKRPNFDAWANDIRLLREQDRRSYEDIARVFTWANKHDFWSGNILSPAKLRKQFDVLKIQMQQAQKQTNVRTHKIVAAATMTYEDFIGNEKA